MSKTKQKTQKSWWLAPIFLSRRLVFGIIFCLFAIKSIFTLDPDFGWHLRSGQYIIAHGIPTHDIFTYTAPNFPWIHHEWLADVISALVYQIGGYWLLGMVFAALWTLALVFVSKKNPLPIVTLIAACALLSFSGFRAMTWTVFFAALLYVLLQKSGKIRLLTVPLMLLWANMHGGFVIGLAYLIWKAVMEHSKNLAALLILSVLATLITPYGPGMYVEIWRTLGDRSLHGSIREWKSFAISTAAVVITGIWAAMRIISSKSWTRTVFAFETLLLAGTVMSVRNLPLFCLFALAWLSQIFCQIQINRDDIEHRYFPIRKLFGAAMLAVMLVMAWGVREALVAATIDPEARYPRQIAQRLEKQPCAGRVFNDYNVGGYLIWRAPNTPVYIDGRMPSWDNGGVKYLKTYSEVLKNPNVQKREFARYDIRCVVIRADSDLAKRLQREGWRRELVDGQYELARRSAV